MIIETCSRTGDMHFIHNKYGTLCVQWVQVGWEVIVYFVDIGRIYDYHSLNFLFIIINEKCTMREAIATVCRILEIFLYSQKSVHMVGI